MKYIVIVGKKGVGKDTFASLLLQKMVSRGIPTVTRALAAPIKNVLTYMFRCDPDIFNDPMKKETPQDVLYSRTPREVMQQFGTEFAQGVFGPQIWVDFLINEAERDIHHAVTIVTDIRFKHELDMFIAMGARVIYVKKDVTCFDQDVKSFGLKWLKKIRPKKTHISEAGLDQYRREGDALIENNEAFSWLDMEADDWLLFHIDEYRAAADDLRVRNQQAAKGWLDKIRYNAGSV